MRKIDGCDFKKFGALDSSERTIAISGDRWWPPTAKEEGDDVTKTFLCVIYGRNVLSAKRLEVSLLGVGTVLRVEKEP